jgi:hypothetical protein
MLQKIQGAQRDFSFGEVDVTLKRADDHPARKAGLRQMLNMRILNSGGLEDRPGRSALFPANGSDRIEEITISPGNTFKIAFGPGSLKVFSATGAVVANFINQGNGVLLPWVTATIASIVYAKLRLSVYITFPGMIPQVLAWDGAASWTLTDYQELVVGNQKRTWFYRISPQNITLLPGAQTGSGVSLQSSDPLFVPAHVGTRMRFINRQMLITSVTDSMHATVTIEESLPGAQTVSFSVDPSNTFSVGDIVLGSISGSKAIVVQINAASKQVNVQLISTNSSLAALPLYQQGAVAFQANEVMAGPGGGLTIATVTGLFSPVVGVTFWDEEVMNAYQGYPASCFSDQFRLGFCNFPSVPNGIGWSAINSPTDQYVVGASTPSGAMFELAPDAVQIFYVVPGPESSEFVFADRKLYYIKIDASNPLKPGSVSFQTLSGDGCAQVQPRTTQEVILYVNAGRNSVIAIVASGAYYRPFNTRNLCDFHSHLFSGIAAIAVPNADGGFNERYAYVLNQDGSLVVGKYSLQEGQIVPTIGWGRWSGVGTVKWVAAWAADVLFTTTYFAVETICEILDETQYLDGAVFVNNLPAAFAAPVGKGPLWWVPNQAVSLMDQATRSMGTYQIDANGFIIPQGNGGEDLTIASLTAGQSWTSMIEPFCPSARAATRWPRSGCRPIRPSCSRRAWRTPTNIRPQSWTTPRSMAS